MNPALSPENVLLNTKLTIGGILATLASLRLGELRENPDLLADLPAVILCRHRDLNPGSMAENHVS